MTDERWDRLDALAGAASEDGPFWHNASFLKAFVDSDDADVFTNEDAAFIAACDPATIRELVAAVRERDELRALLSEAIEVVHQSEGSRRHADPNDKTGWHVKGIETCADALCVASRAALHREDGA